MQDQTSHGEDADGCDRAATGPDTAGQRALRDDQAPARRSNRTMRAPIARCERRSPGTPGTTGPGSRDPAAGGSGACASRPWRWPPRPCRHLDGSAAGPGVCDLAALRRRPPSAAPRGLAVDSARALHAREPGGLPRAVGCADRGGTGRPLRIDEPDEPACRRSRAVEQPLEPRVLPGTHRRAASSGSRTDADRRGRRRAAPQHHRLAPGRRQARPEHALSRRLGTGTGPVRVVWPHRWEHDKGPDELLALAEKHTSTTAICAGRSSASASARCRHRWSGSSDSSPIASTMPARSPTGMPTCSTWPRRTGSSRRPGTSSSGLPSSRPC